MRYAVGDGLTEMESTHPQFVDCGPVRNGLGPDLRDWTTLPAYRERLERAKRHRAASAEECFRSVITTGEMP